MLFVGTGDTARKVARQILDQHDFAYRVIGFIDDDASRIGERIVNPAIVGTPADIDRLIAEHHIDRIVVGLSDRRGKLPVEELLRAKMAGIRVEDATTTYERVTGKILIDDLRPSWLIFSDGFRVSRVTRLMKRTIDLMLSLVARGAGAAVDARHRAAGAARGRPPGALPAGARRRERPHLHARRSSARCARTRKRAASRSGPRTATIGSPASAASSARRASTSCRSSGTCVRGDMSFVGPRPERPFFVEQLSKEIPFYQQRHAVKPGLTGWAQVKYRYGSSLDDAMEKLRYDLYYIKHLSVIFDLTIVFDTVKVVLFRKGCGVTDRGLDASAGGSAAPHDRPQRRHPLPARSASRWSIGLRHAPLQPAPSRRRRPTACGCSPPASPSTSPILDLGYGGAMVKFIAQYRAHRDARALNEIASTLFFVFAGFGVLAYLVVDRPGASTSSTSSRITPAQAEIGKWILLIIGVNVAINFPFAVYGGVSSGFQRYDINNIVAIVSSVRDRRGRTSPSVLAGYGLIALVAATTSVRFVDLLRLPPQRLPRLSRCCASARRSSARDRLREVTGFSVYSSVIDWANKLNYELDEVVIGVFLGPAPVAVWAVADRIISGTQRLTNQGNARALPRRRRFGRDQRTGRLQQVLLEGHAAVAGDGACRSPSCSSSSPSRSSAPGSGSPEMLGGGAGHPDPRVRRRAARRQRHEHDAAQGRGTGPACRDRQHRDRAW